ncbi:MAG: LamG-like jellyroll fold domain-containing protein, partial [Bacteroidota bacterium]
MGKSFAKSFFAFCFLLSSFFIKSQTGSALNFDGLNDYVSRGIVSSATNSITMQAHVIMTNTGSVGQVVFFNGNTGGNGYGLYFPANSKVLNLLLGGISLASTGYSITLNQWTELTLVIQNNICYVYVNGVSVMVYGSGIAVPSGSFLIGADNAGGNNFFGNIDEVRVWSKSLSQCEIQTYLNCEIPTTASNLIANYHFNQGTAAGTNTGINTLIDASGNSNTCTLNNFTLSGSTSNWVSPGGVVSGYTVTSAPTATLGITGNGNAILAGSNTPSLSNFTDMGANTTRTFVITNVGTGTLYIDNIYFTGTNASLFNYTTSYTGTMAASGTNTGTIVFTPTAAGTFTAIANIISNDCANPNFSFVVSASASAASALNLDGVNDFISTTNSSSFALTTAGCAEGWFKTTATNQMEIMRLYSGADNGLEMSINNGK